MSATSARPSSKAIANICGMTQAALLARSSDYATPPWGDEQQARFINACIEIETSLDPHALLFTLHKIEKKFGRDRARETRWGPRTLDLDLIAYDDVTIDKPELTLPHPAAVRTRLRAGAAGRKSRRDRLIAGRSVAAALAELSTDGNRAVARPRSETRPKTTVWLGGRHAWHFPANKSQQERRPGATCRMTSAT